ncbi:hypothetical protein [Mycolicibacterium septicum]|uniref:hypothetical protein n=1 Tax=Mycolicibacterium septicum TaxID=98668 RepID=UPI001AF1B8EC|nr:hypothetical protein [Mycolicibacterium septicum]QRY51709.1 hypothetical protein JVX95_30760 [Mycolicibacterium septicum]
MSALIEGLAAIHAEHVAWEREDGFLDRHYLECSKCGKRTRDESDHRLHVAELQASWLREHLHEVAEELGMAREWSVWVNDGLGLTPEEYVCDDRQDAVEQAAETCQSCDHCRGTLPKHVIHRLVTDWKRDD